MLQKWRFDPFQNFVCSEKNHFDVILKIRFVFVFTDVHIYKYGGNLGPHPCSFALFHAAKLTKNAIVFCCCDKKCACKHIGVNAKSKKK